MSIVAKVGTTIFGVHGGISHQVSCFHQIEVIKKPIKNYENHFCSDLVWSDPTNDSKDYVESIRGQGMQFGINAVKEFLQRVGVKHVIRAHQCVFKGIEKFANDMVYTVFSCSNYQDSLGNYCGLIFINNDENIEAFSLPPIEQIERSVALFTKYGDSGIIYKDISESSAALSINRSQFLGFFESPIVPTYQTRNCSLDLL